MLLCIALGAVTVMMVVAAGGRRMRPEAGLGTGRHAEGAGRTPSII